MTDPILRYDVDAKAVLAALSQVAPKAGVYLKRAAEVTANRIAREARGRVARRTGETMEGILVEESQDGKGWVVVTINRRMRNLPLWIELGTQAGKPGSHTAAPRPFFDVSAQLEQGPHLRRVLEALQDAIRETGLGE